MTLSKQTVPWRKSFITMNKKFLFLLTCMFSGLALFAQKTNITGKLKYKEPVKKVLLNYRENDKTVTDSANVKNGTFSFSRNMKQPTLVTIMVRFEHKDSTTRRPEYRQFYLEPGNIHITINDSIKNAVVTGSKSEKEFEKLQKMQEPFSARMNALNAQYMEFRKNKDEAGMQKVMLNAGVDFNVIRNEINGTVQKCSIDNQLLSTYIPITADLAGTATSIE